MIPQIAERLIERYSSPHGVVLDPFCGSGGVLVESVRKGLHSVGLDINPLACLLARVKTSPLDPKLLLNRWESLRKEIGKEMGALRFRQLKVDIPDFSETNLSYWFKPYMIEELALIKKHLDEIEEEKIREFFQVCFSNVVRIVSGTRKGEFKLYRMPEDQWKRYNPDVLEVFKQKIDDAISKMGEFFDFVVKNRLSATAKVFEADARAMFTEGFPHEAGRILREESVDLIVTSPPYGDSRTTVAYGQFSRYSSIWLGYDKTRVLEIDRKSLGGQPRDKIPNSKTFERMLQKITSEKRAEEVKSYFVDLEECLQKLQIVLTPQGYACFVLGNRTVNKAQIPTDKILAELGKNVGFERVTVINRRIPSKRIPWKSSPTNVPGQKVNTISRENIVVLRK